MHTSFFQAPLLKKIMVGFCHLVVGVTAQSVHAQILIGQTAGFTGAVSAGVQETWAGAKLHINEINAKGGLFGQKIEVIQKDDQFKPELAAANAKSLIEDDKVIALFLSRGTPHTEAILPVIEKYGVPYFVVISNNNLLFSVSDQLKSFVIE